MTGFLSIYINNLKRDLFLKSYAIYFTGSMLVAFLNYLFHPILGRLLSPADFGDIQVLISLIAQAGVLFGAFSIVVVNITSNLENPSERDAIIAELQKIAICMVAIVIAPLVIFSSLFEYALNLSNHYLLFSLAIFLFLSSLVAFRNGYLQGKGRFSELSLGGVIYSIARLVLAIVLVTMGFGVLGVATSLVMAEMVSLAYLFLKTRETLHLNTPTNIHVLEKGRVAKELLYGALVLFSTLLVTVMYTSDVIIVKHYFDPHEAGMYSGISAVAKIIYFAIAPVAAILLSSVKLNHTPQENRKMLWKSLGIAVVIGVAGFSTFYIFYGMVVKGLIGSNYQELAYILPKVGLVMFLSAIANVLVFYFLALRRYVLIPVSLAGMALMVVVVVLNHSTLNDILNSLALSLILTIILLGAIYAKDYFYNHPPIQ